MLEKENKMLKMVQLVNHFLHTKLDLEPFSVEICLANVYRNHTVKDSWVIFF